MLSKVISAAVLGIDAYPVEVEVDIASRGLPFFSTVGLPDAAVKESKERVRAALKNTGFDFPLKQVVVNLAPADIKKEGSAFDLPIAIGMLIAEGVLNQEMVNGYLIGNGAILSGIDLRNTNLKAATLTGADLTGSNLQGADLSGANLNNSIIEGTNLSGTTLGGVSSGGITGGVPFIFTL